MNSSESESPLVSVVTIVYNDFENIEDTIKSVLSQRQDLIEYIVIDGGSSDSTLEVLDMYKDDIDVLISEPDRGIYDAMSKGLGHASGDWVIFMNSGDSFFSSNVLDILFDRNFFKSSKLCIYGKASWRYGKKPFPFVFPLLLKLPNHQTMFVKRKWLLLNGFDPELKILADLDQKMKISRENGFVNSDIHIALSLEGGVSQTNKREVNRELSVIRRRYIPWFFRFLSIIF